MCHCPLLKNLSINLCFIIPVRFRQTQLSLPQISGYCISRFHPTDAVLACGSDGQVTIFKGVNGSVPLTNWRIEREFKGQNVKGIWSIEWNVSYSNFTEYPLVIFSAFKSCLNIKRRAMGSTNKMALFHFYFFMCRWTGPNWLLGATMAPSSLGLIPKAKSFFKWKNLRSHLESNGIHSDQTFLLLVIM